MKKTLPILAAAAALASVGAWYLLRDGAGEPVRYRTAKVERGEITETVTATGTINPVVTVQVGSQVSGTIQEIRADFNSLVKKGQVIARIDPVRFRAAVDQSRANLASSLANLEKAKASRADAERTLSRNRGLIREGFVPQSDVDAAETAFHLAVAQERVADASVAQARASLRAAETDLGWTSIVSPVDGIVISRSVDVGQTVAASFQTPTLFTIAKDLSRMQIDTSVDESDIARVRSGLPVDFTVDAWPGRKFTGVVEQVRNAPVVTQNVVTYNVVVRVENRELLLKPGMTANAVFRVRTVADALKIPNAALRFRPKDAPQPDGKGKGGAARGGAASAAGRESGKDGATARAATAVRGGAGAPAAARPPGAAEGGDGAAGTAWISGADGKPFPVPVRTGINDGSFTQLLSGDLREGQELLVGEAAKKANGNSGTPPGMGMGGGMRMR